MNTGKCLLLSAGIVALSTGWAAAAPAGARDFLSLRSGPGFKQNSRANGMRRASHKPTTAAMLAPPIGRFELERCLAGRELLTPSAEREFVDFNERIYALVSV